MKKILVVVAAIVGMSWLATAPASAAGQVCYDVNISIAGQAPIAQAGCQDLP